MNNYLYGASVQGIQDFIFKTNKLVDVIGASEMVEQICTILYTKIIDVDEKDIIVSAAGNLKFLLSEEDCKSMVRNFPKKVMEYAPGITISQAVVKIDDDSNLTSALDKLEERLRAQRNIVPMPIEIGVVGTQRDRQSGGVAVQFKHGKAICQATKQKQAHANKFSLINKIVEGNVEEFVSKQTDDLNVGRNSFIAVVHADANGLGNLIQEMGKKLQAMNANNETIKKTFSDFSKNLDTATKNAAQAAFNSLDIVVEDATINTLPIRPVVLGGDDLTILIQADMALPFVEKFLSAFEIQTKEIIGKQLTACAGIAYVKAKFPLHYAMNLSEQLCKEAKDKTERNDSGVSFFKVQDSYVGKIADMRNRVKINQGIAYSAYDMSKLEVLNSVLSALESNSDDSKSGVSKLRQWIGELTKDQSSAQFMLERIKSVNEEFYESLKTEDKQVIYDAMQIHSLKH